MKFLCLAYLDRGLSPGPDAFAQYGTMREEMVAAGVFVDAGQLSSSEASKVVRISDGQVEVQDGSPSAGISPIAYFLIDCADTDAAVEWAQHIPAASYGSIEVRPPR